MITTMVSSMAGDAPKKPRVQRLRRRRDPDPTRAPEPHRGRNIKEMADRMERRWAATAREIEVVGRLRGRERKRGKHLDAALADVLVGRQPHIVNQEDLDVVAVPDPYNERPVHHAVKSLRDDPLGRLFKRRQITQAQHDAGRAWQRKWEQAEIGGARAIDPTKESVDGRRFVDAFDDEQAKAINWLKRASGWLGLEGDALIRDVLGNRMFIEQVAVARGMSPKADGSDLKYLGRRFREALDTLAARLGYDVQGKATVHRDDHAKMAALAGDPRRTTPQLHRAVRLAGAFTKR